MRIAVKAGQRGIDNMVLTAKTIADWVKSRVRSRLLFRRWEAAAARQLRGRELSLPALGITEKTAGCTKIDKSNPRVVRIPNSLHIQHIMLSESYYDEVKNIEGIEIESEPEEMVFDENGNLF